jgi:hypothetical protein
MLYTIKPAENRKVLIYRKDHVSETLVDSTVGCDSGACLRYRHSPQGGGHVQRVLLDRAGRVRFQHVGFSEKRKDEYETHVQSLLREPVAH